MGVGTTLGRKGLDESVLAGYTVIDDPLGPKNVTPTAIDDEPDVCLHEDVENEEDDPGRGTCAECGEEFELADPAIAERD